MSNEAVLRMLTEVGQIINNTHVVYSSERHGNTWIEKDALYVHVKKIAQLCELMADSYDPDQIDVVIGPTMGGTVLAQWMAYHLSGRRSKGEVLPAFAEKMGTGEHKKFVIKRGYDSVISGKNVVVVDDLLTTGQSASKVIKCVKAHKGKVLAMSVICNRGSVKPADIGNVPINALVDIELESWAEADCPLCKKGVPVNTSVGKGKYFCESRGITVLQPGKKAKRTKN